MQQRLLTIYYGIDRLPYKDENREVHYPIVSSQSGGTLITGENNTSKLVFYVGRIGGGAKQWIANLKKPDGTLSYRLLTGGQSVLLSNGQSDYRAELDISDIFADQVGDVFIGLQGYSGETVIVENDGTYEISGNPDVLATGTIKIKVNYAPNVLAKGETITPTTEQQIMAALGGKIDTSSSIFVVNGLDGFDFSDFANFQTFFDIETGQFYRKTGDTLTLIELELKDMLIDGTKLTTYLGQYITATQATQSFVAKVDSASIVYGRNALNQEYAYGVDPTNSYGSSTVAVRYNGQLKAPTPVADSDLANKGYVDSSIASAIEGVEEKADVSDIVGTYAELQAYDTSKLVIDDIIKVLQDSTHSNAMSYYRWLGNEDGWEYIGSEGPYPTISEMNTALSAKVDKTTSASKLYGTDSVGAQATIPVEDNIGDVARRDDDGQLVVPLTPTANGQATSKKYVDDQDALNEKLANKVTSLSASSTDVQYASAKAIYDFAISLLRKSYQEVDTTEYPTVNDFLASTGEEGIFYLYPITNGFEQYIWENNSWLDLGTTTIDLSGYATKVEVEPRLFNVINASDIVNDTLTQEQYNLITNGKRTQILGTFLILYNPIILSVNSSGTFGIMIGSRGGDEFELIGFNINSSTKVVSRANSSSGMIRLNSIYHINGKQLPAYPSSTGTYSIVCADGTLAWVDYLYTIAVGKYVVDNTITTLPYETISQISLSSDVTFSLKSAPTGCYPIYDAIITNVGSSAINITLTSVAKIICNDASITISNNVVTLPAGMVVELNIQNGCAVIINFDL